MFPMLDNLSYLVIKLRYSANAFTPANYKRVFWLRHLIG